MPYDMKDLIINLSEACLPAFDNANEIVPKQCQAVFSGCVTGFTHRERRLFTNFEAARISFRRPAIVNGLVVPFSKPDLLSRCLLMKTEKIDDEKDQSDLLREFEDDRPSILGGMLTTLSKAVKILPEVESIPPDLTRFRDWARVFIAMGMALGFSREDGLKMLEKLKNRGGHYVASVVSVCESVVKLTEHPNLWRIRHKETTAQMWVGSVSELLGELEYVAQKNRIDLTEFPKGAAQLGRELENIPQSSGYLEHRSEA